MRDLPVIKAAWESGGPFIGDSKPVTRVTIQEPWPELSGSSKEYYFLRTATTTGVGSSTDRGVPMRFWQKKANNQGEKEIPNIATVSIDRSIDQDASTFNIVLDNQWMYLNGTAPAPGQPGHSFLGQPGYFVHDYGDTPESQARWGHEQNDWHNYFVPNGLIRVYTGFGGDYPTPIDDAVADGNLALYGVFLIDDVNISTNGKITLTGRDMAKLLIEQQLFPPLVPNSKYPLSYCRWEEKNTPTRNAPKVVNEVVSTSVSPGIKPVTYYTSSVDAWYGPNSFLYGHTGIHSVDGNVDTYALGEGNSGPDRPFAVNYWEYTVNADMNGIFVHPWAGGYTMYVSVMEGGVWQGASTVPYDPSDLYSTQPHVVNTGANIPYVASFTVPWEQAREYSLPRDYNAQRVRITFRHLAFSGLGPWKYRAGVREFRALGLDASHDTSTSTSKLVSTWVQAAGGMYDSEKTFQFGYMTVSRHEQQDAFGDARHKAVSHKDVGPQTTGLPPLPTCVRVTDGGGGYYVLDAAGSLDAYGDAVWYGSPYTTDGFRQDPDGQIWDMAITPSGDGYWILNVEGNVYAYGDAVDYGSGAYPPDIVSIEGHPTNMGYWTLRDDGRVFNFGATTHYGNLPTTGSGALKYDDDPDAPLFQGTGERARCLRATKTGNGYWILTSYGRVYAFGDAIKYGEPAQLSPHTTNFFSESYWELIPGPDDNGYLLVHADGSIHAFGDIPYFGTAVPGSKHVLRYDGNYLDYADIWRDLLLWSGFLLYDSTHPSNQPAPVYAGLESTGAFSSECLPDEMFDKKPVIDAITELREALGYIFYVDHYGRPHVQSSNTWHFGNFNEDGVHVEELMEIDEKKQLTDYAVSTSDQDVRSKIIISSHDPYADLSGTVTNNYTPPSAARLRGIIKPAMWVNSHLSDPTEQRIMAELIGLQISFQERLGQLTCMANPALEVDDQVRIYERQTGESNVHYVRGINFTHDLNSGSYMSTITTHWLGEGRDTGDVFGDIYPISAELQARVDSQQYGKYQRDPGSTI